MFPYHHNNYLQLGYNNTPLILRKSFNDRGSIYIAERAKYIPTSFKEEVIRAAKLIYETHGKVSLCISGGADSQCMLYGFIEAGVPFDVVIWRMSNGFNDFDTKKALRVCKKLNLEFTVIEKDIVKWIKSTEFVETIHQLKTGWIGLHTRIPFYTHNYKNSIVMGLADFANCDYLPKKNEFTGFQPIVKQILHNIAYNYDLKMIISFFQYTPELVLSQLTPEILKAYNNFIPGVRGGFKGLSDREFSISKKVRNALIVEKRDMKLFKFHLYTKNFPKVTIPKKWHGNEGLKEYNKDMWNKALEISNISQIDAGKLEIPLQFDGERIEGHNFLRNSLLPIES